MSKSRNLANLLSGGVPAFGGTDALDVPAGTTAQRPSSPNTGFVRFNTDLDQLEQYTTDGWKGISAPPTITTTDVTTLQETDSTQTVVITGQNFDTGATAVLIGGNGTVYTPTTSTRTNGSSITIVYSGGDVLDNTVSEPLTVKVTNGSGLTATLDGQININASPTWSTTAGSLGTIFEDNAMSNIALSASDADGEQVSFTLTSGSSLPSGLSLNTSGVISGTPNVNDTYNASGVTHNFSVDASDSTSTTTRSFNIVRKWRDGSSAATAATNAESIKSLTGTTSSGEFYLLDRNGNPITAYCDMNTNGGGWVGLYNIDTNDGIRYDWNATGWWRSDTVQEGSHSNFWTASYKGIAVQDFTDWTEIMMVNHAEGTIYAYGAYDILSGYNSYSFKDIMAISDSGNGTEITQNRKTQWGNSGWTSNSNREGNNAFRCEFTDSGGENSYPLVVNWTTGGSVYKYNANTNKVRITTRQGASNSTHGTGGYQHSYGGIGGTHDLGYIYNYEYSGYAEYCQQPMQFGTDLQRAGNTCNDSQSIVNRDIAIFVR